MTYYVDASVANASSKNRSKWFVKIIVEDENGNRIFYSSDPCDNNAAELQSILHGCEHAQDGDTIVSDSLNATLMANGFPVKMCEEYKQKVDQILKLTEQKNISILWTPRKDNKPGISLDKILYKKGNNGTPFK